MHTKERRMIIGMTDDEELELNSLLKQTIENTTQKEWERVIELNRKILDGLAKKVDLERLKLKE
jgi:hypothetical protein